MRRLRFLLQVTLSLVCLAAAVAMVSPEHLRTAWQQADRLVLALVVALLPFAIALRAYRWWYLLGKEGIDLSLRTVGRITLIGHAFNLFLPASLGDVVRSYYAWRKAGEKEVMLATAIVDKVVALFSLCVIGIACSLAVNMMPLAVASAIILLPLAIFLIKPGIIPWNWGAYLFRLIFRKEIHIETLVEAAKIDRATLFATVWISFLGWGVTNLMYYFAWKAFSQSITVWYAFAFAPLINLMRVIPITVSGLGSADLLIVFLGRSVGMPQSEALMGSLVINVVLIVVPGLVGALALFADRR